MCPEYQVGEEGTRSRGRSGCRWTLGLGRAEITVGGGGAPLPCVRAEPGIAMDSPAGPELGLGAGEALQGKVRDSEPLRDAAAE